MVLVMLVVAAVGEFLIDPSNGVRAFDAAWVDRTRGWIAGHEALEDAAVAWAEISHPKYVHLLVLLVAAALVALGVAPPRALLTFVIGVIGSALAALCKVIVARPRPQPDDPLSHPDTWAYPSGHATGAAVAAVLLVALLQAVPVPWLRRTATALVLVAAALTALDRLVLGVHFVTDVLAGLVLGTSVALIGLWALRGDFRHPLR